MDNYIEKLKAKLEEYDAKAERLAAEERLRHNEWREDTKAQFDAMGDWTEAAWDEFIAKAEQQWYDTVSSVSGDDDDSSNRS